MKKILFLILIILALPIAFACDMEGMDNHSHDNEITGAAAANSCDIGSGSGMMGGYGMMPGYGMMGNFGFGFFSIIYALLLIGITILVYVWIIKLLKSMGGKK